jgi:hypothetical protein
MLSLLLNFNQARLQSKLYFAQSKIERINARTARNRANAQASAVEHTAKRNQELAARNLMTSRANQREAEGSLRVTRDQVLIDSSGTGESSLRNQQLALDAEIDNLALSASIATVNAWQKATDIRRQGEITAASHDAQAQQLAMAAKETRRSANFALIGGIAGGALSAYQAYNSAADYNTSLKKDLDAANESYKIALDEGKISQKDYDAYIKQNQDAYESRLISTSRNATLGFAQGSSMFYHGFNSFNPYTAALSADANNRKNNWGSYVSVLAGNVPYKVPAAGTVFSQYI